MKDPDPVATAARAAVLTRRVLKMLRSLPDLPRADRRATALMVMVMDLETYQPAEATPAPAAKARAHKPGPRIFLGRRGKGVPA